MCVNPHSQAALVAGMVRMRSKKFNTCGFDFGIENLWNILFQKFDMFLWTSGFQNPLVHTDFDMFVDE